MNLPPEWYAFHREAQQAAIMITFNVNSLGRANLSQWDEIPSLQPAAERFLIDYLPMATEVK
ncbi:MAG TPA: hypothetical protein VMW34_17490 [Anaerolineales bacterium]|nr:hypothetical protein [Anaerolineales bacterium]